MQVWVQPGGAAVHSLLGVLRDGVGRVVGWKLMTLFSAQNRSLEGDVVGVG